MERVRWGGLGAGEGRLRERDVTVAIAGRSAGSTRRVVVTLDVDDQQVRSGDVARRAAVGDRALGTGAA